ncbi:adenosylcobinamide-GDP ribazoletransferase [Paenibacillus psychroresistens]|uniref:Adenosylcobinamide-GDP ribazoletransferase n=1 Tax=Paenibacillus psychroresistens TaxID=1778678 RepID=A0A6B8RHH5_9BACL|nr:adenosylcobinamide-GDP ribazoletransferase [Paenibacillus psychroresistens]QGQ94983.1 adenosylcobinamide-GDP ribazoletransferase [Paenibacillus psychroresistens]
MHAFRALIISWVLACLAAFQFLTRFPLPVKMAYTEKLFRRSVIFYPFVGAVVGLINTLAGASLREWLPSFPTSIILLSLWIAITGGVHLGGLMNTADGVIGHRSREQMLEIMKDGRVGAMGVIVCVLYMLLKLSFIMELVDGSWRFAAVFFFCTPIWSRWFMGIAVARWPYVKVWTTDGLGSLYRNVRSQHLVGSTSIAYLLSLGALWIFGFGGVELFCYSIGFPVISGLMGWLIGNGLVRKLGGLTGRAYGALNELLELLLLLGALILWN